MEGNSEATARICKVIIVCIWGGETRAAVLARKWCAKRTTTRHSPPLFRVVPVMRGVASDVTSLSVVGTAVLVHQVSRAERSVAQDRHWSAMRRG